LNKLLNILLLCIFLLLITLYILWTQNSSKPIKIEEIKVAPLQMEKKEQITPSQPLDILSRLKVATEKSKETLIVEKRKREIEEIKQEKKKIVQEKKRLKAQKRKIAQVKKRIEEKKTKKEINKTKALQTKRRLSREEEIALCQKKYANSLDAVNIPDAYYFEKPKVEKNHTKNPPLKFVQKLGVVGISNQYETSFSVPKKEELAKEGIVQLSNAEYETEEIKKLEFVDTIGVVEVSKSFESIEAYKYLY